MSDKAYNPNVTTLTGKLSHKKLAEEYRNLLREQWNIAFRVYGSTEGTLEERVEECQEATNLIMRKKKILEDICRRVRA